MTTTTPPKKRLTTSAMIASFADPGQKTAPAPFGHALAEVQRHADHRIHRVGHRGSRGWARLVGALAQDLGLGAEPCQFDGYRASEDEMHVGPVSLGRRLSGVDRDDVPVETAAVRAKLFRFADDAATGGVVQGTHPFERGDRVQPDHAVDVLPDVALELA